jgi:hypothetical protein
MVASAYAVLRISLSHGKREIREISTGNEDGHILGVCTIPAGPGGSAACAILRDGGRISICGLDTPDGCVSLTYLPCTLMLTLPGSPGWSLAPRNSSIFHLSTTTKLSVGPPMARSTCKISITHRARLYQCRSSNTSLVFMYSLRQPCRLQTRPGYVGPLVLQSWENLATLPTFKVSLHLLKAAAISRARVKRPPSRQGPFASYPLLPKPTMHLHADPFHRARLRSLLLDNLDHLPVWPTYPRFKMKRRKKKPQLPLMGLDT